MRPIDVAQPEIFLADRHRQAGFSLLELMITVAIVGILSTIAIPNYKMMTSKARTVEAKEALAGIYTAEQAFYAEYEYFTSCLYQAGYQPDGGYFYYLTGFYNGAPCGACNIDPSTGASCNLSVSVPYLNTFRDDATYTMNAWVNPTLTDAGVPGAYDVADSLHFTAVAFGSISSSAVFDIWTVDQDKNILNIQNGF